MSFAEMFSGIGGFRFGLEKASQVSVDSQQRFGNEEGQCEPQFEGSNGRVKQEFRCNSHKQIGDNDTAFGSTSIEEWGKPQLPSGFKCVWANDFDKYACQIYRKHFGDKELVEADIRTIDPSALPDFDLLIAGFPCQSFSLAGKRRGFEDTRGTLFYEVARVAAAKRPKLLLLENVKGLLSNDEGRTFAKILQTLDELDFDVEAQVLNSKHYGVPQNRERVFIVGHSRAEPTKQIFPIRQVGEGVDEPCGEAQSEGSRVRTANSLNCSGSGKERNLIERKVRIHRDDEKKSEIQGYSFFPETAEYIDVVDNHPKNILVANTVSHRYGKDGSENLIHCHWPRQGNPKTGGTGPLFSDETVFALDSSPHHVINQSRIRRLTPTECERLQGFPDGWTEGVSDTQRYKLLGNAVTTNVIQFLGEKLLEVLGV